MSMSMNSTRNAQQLSALAMGGRLALCFAMDYRFYPLHRRPNSLRHRR